MTRGVPPIKWLHLTGAIVFKESVDLCDPGPPGYDCVSARSTGGSPASEPQGPLGGQPLERCAVGQHGCKEVRALILRRVFVGAFLTVTLAPPALAQRLRGRVAEIDVAEPVFRASVWLTTLAGEVQPH